MNRLTITMILLLSAIGCSQKETPQQLREQTAQATAEAKSDAKAVAQGLRDGWSRDKPLNLNTATKDQLLALPDMTREEADRVIADRPYNEPNDLVKRRVLPREEYDKISDRIVAR